MVQPRPGKGQKVKSEDCSRITRNQAGEPCDTVSASRRCATRDSPFWRGRSRSYQRQPRQEALDVRFLCG